MSSYFQLTLVFIEFWFCGDNMMKRIFHTSRVTI